MSTSDKVTPGTATSIVLEVGTKVGENGDAFLDDLAKKFSEAACESPSDDHDSGHEPVDIPNEPLVSSPRPNAEKKPKKYARFADRAKRALKPLAGKKPSAKKRGSEKFAPATVGPSTNSRASIDTRRSDRLSVPVSLISKEAFSKTPSQDELKQELERMRNPFPNVPKYAGNPPWVTRYHPDLIKSPTKKS